jgi:phosphoribosyl 1,2-cyclic phosphodiesterase
MNTAADTITIRFRGVRGSHPMPGPSTVRYGGNTSCQEIRVGGRLLVFDAGTGIIGLGWDLVRAGQTNVMAVFFSHYHHDHIDGFLYFRPAYRPGVEVHIFGPAENPEGDILHVMERMSCPAAHPVKFTRMGMEYTTASISTGDVVIWRPEDDAPVLLASGGAVRDCDVVVRVLRNTLHPLSGVLNFRVEYMGKSYVYATDVEGDEEAGDTALADFAKGADVLAHDGQYTCADYEGRKGWGHSTVEMAIKTAKMAGVKRLVVIHHDPESDDDKLDAMEAEARKQFPGTVFAQEGGEIVI